MRFSAILAAALTAVPALAAPISGYTWSITNWSGGWIGSGWSNYQVTAPAAVSNGVSIPALSLTSTCDPWGYEGTVLDCSSLIADNTDGRTFTATIGAFSNSGVTTYATYTFKSGSTTYKVTGTVTGVQGGASSFTVTGLQLAQA